MDHEQENKQEQNTTASERSEADKKMDPRDVAESKRVEWEKQNKAKD